MDWALGSYQSCELISVFYFQGETRTKWTRSWCCWASGMWSTRSRNITPSTAPTSSISPSATDGATPSRRSPLQPRHPLWLPPWQSPHQASTAPCTDNTPMTPTLHQQRPRRRRICARTSSAVPIARCTAMTAANIVITDISIGLTMVTIGGRSLLICTSRVNMIPTISMANSHRLTRGMAVIYTQGWVECEGRKSNVVLTLVRHLVIQVAF